MALNTLNMMFYAVLLAAIVSRCASEVCDSNLLASINRLRANHGAGALTWSLDLAYQSQAMLDLLEGADGQDNADLDISVQSVWSSCVSAPNSPIDATCKGAVSSWYSQGKNYKYTATPLSANRANLEFDSPNYVGDFVQLVWKSTAQVGCSSMISQDAAKTETCLLVACTFAMNIKNTDNGLFTNVAEPKEILNMMEAESVAVSADRRRTQELGQVTIGEESSASSEEGSISSEESSATETSSVEDSSPTETSAETIAPIPRRLLKA